MTNEITDQFQEFSDVFGKFVYEMENMALIAKAVQTMSTCLRQGGKIMSCGNGGSYSDAQHFASELVGKYRGARPALAAMALTDGGILSCVANDFGYNQVFKRQVEAVGRDGDVLLALSTSGNSENILIAAERAKMMGISVIGISGQKGKLREYCDTLIEIPHIGSADRIQEHTIIIIHIIVMMIERQMSQN